jgi:FtsZ-interacting cell division protein ZipA
LTVVIVTIVAIAIAIVAVGVKVGWDARKRRKCQAEPAGGQQPDQADERL